MKRKRETSANSIWNKEGFLMCGLGEKNKIIARIKHFGKCCRWSWQRIVRGYADCDKWKMYQYLQNLIPDMLQDLRDKRYGSPGFLGENYTNEEGILVNDTCHEECGKNRMSIHVPDRILTKRNTRKRMRNLRKNMAFWEKNYRRKKN